ncbi:MAG: hypothetical protein DIZ80_09710 [endosymbiont of Galathealinum brachiosum]|uniref:Uncharacterized protein n=1 Tax=endosymbiont of Galathealinum brachiosum TaxID=2200906 RepID=A0A370DCF2_9GAMM|nr:MAG: hypothetical protein DIZ80_09710 [endosymbiont of Galathealinum brachiosum]
MAAHQMTGQYMIQFKANYSRTVLLQLIFILITLCAIILFNSDYLIDLYLKNQATKTGYIINSIIVGLFALGLFRIVIILLRYSIEESALAKFIKNVELNENSPISNIRPKSLISRRYSSVIEISKQNVSVNHSALAATLLASESTRLSLPKFISNILILTGVFGTIVSLSIALLGASNIIDSADGMGSMSMVIHGMSTALSTTTTAIICYLIFGYMYLKLTDVQTQLLSGIEQTTNLYILPRFTYQTDSMLHEVGNLVKALHSAADSMAKTQLDYAELGNSLNAITSNYAQSHSKLSSDINEIKHLLKQGFRLPE